MGGDDRLLAGSGDALGDLPIVLGAELTAFGADGLAQIDDIQRGVEHLGIEVEHLLARPEIEKWAERETGAMG